MHVILEFSSFYFSDAVCYCFLELSTCYCICGKEYSPVVKLTKKGINSSIDYGKLRGNKDLAEWSPLEGAVYIHVKGRRLYNNKCRIEREQKAENKPIEPKIE